MTWGRFTGRPTSSIRRVHGWPGHWSLRNWRPHTLLFISGKHIRGHGTTFKLCPPSRQDVEMSSPPMFFRLISGCVQETVDFSWLTVCFNRCVGLFCNQMDIKHNNHGCIAFFFFFFSKFVCKTHRPLFICSSFFDVIHSSRRVRIVGALLLHLMKTSRKDLGIHRESIESHHNHIPAYTFPNPRKVKT